MTLAGSRDAQPQYPFDVRPLTDPADPRAVKAFAAELRSRGVRTSNIAVIVTSVVVGVLLLIVLGGIILSALIAAVATGPDHLISFVPVIFIVVVIVIVGSGFFFSRRRANIRAYRLNGFARANGMTYEGGMRDPGLPGMIFSLGRSRYATDRVRGHAPRFVEFANYQYTTGSGKSSTRHNWGYVAVKLDVPLPNIVLDALGNNTFLGSNLPAAFQKNQRLSPEGDFDEHFALYCPEGYETDALYLFTPDIMARFIDHAAQLDVEIVDDWMFLYTRRQVATLDPATWAWLFSVVGALMTKFDQWARWRDERLAAAQTAAQVAPPPPAPASPQAALPFAAPVGTLAPPPGVAQQGRRLKRGTRWVPIIVVVLFAAFWITTRLFH